jgi:hypothetical protein
MLKRRGIWTPLLAVAIAGPSWAPPVGAAATASIELAYDVDPSLRRCPKEADVRRAIRQRLGHDPFVDAGALKVSVELRPSAQGIEGVVVWRGAQGTREGERRFASTGRRCVALVRAIEFSIGVHLELLAAPSDAADPRPPQPEPKANDLEQEASASPRVSSARTAETAAIVGEAPSRAKEVGRAPLHVLAGLGPLVEWGAAPGVSAGGRLFAAVRRDALSVELGIEASVPSVWRSDDGSGFRARALSGAVAGCGHWNALSFCGLGKGGRLTVTGLGVDEAASPSGWLVRLGARVAGTWPLGQHVLGSLRAELVATPAPWTVELNRAPIWTTPPVAGLLGFDMAATFP